MNVGIIADTHIPFEDPNYLDFCKQTFKEWKCKKFIHIGDVVDNHALSYHETNPDGLGAGNEAGQARKKLKKWAKAFPKLDICIGNHDALAYRKAVTHGIPKDWIRGYNEFWGNPSDRDWETPWPIS